MLQGKRIAVLTAVLAGAGGGVAATRALDENSSPETATRTVIERPAGGTAVANGSNLSAEQIYQRTVPSVAHITSAGVTEQSASPFGGTSRGTATGSGFVVDAKGLIVTNAHVVDGASRITAKVGDGPTRTATLVGKDQSTDLALLRIDPGDQRLTALPLGRSSDLEVGDPTFAIGDPYGLDSTLTTGVVSALNRQIQAPNGFTIDGAIQTDAALNPGNSGGPLLDAQGRIVGVNAQIESGSNGGSGSSQGSNTGIGFAVPSDTVRHVVAQLARGEVVRHAYLGVSTQDRQAGAGALVASVVRGGPAEHGGLRSGDVITTVGGTSVADAADLTSAVDAHAVGDQVVLRVLRDGQPKDLEVRLGRRPAQAPGTSAVP